MLAIERLVREVRRLPVISRTGLAVLVLGGVADLVAHIGALAATDAHHGHGFTPGELAAHVVVFVGMVLILVGVVADGVRRTRIGRSTGDSSKGGM
jgi:hypothetical protein